MKSALLVPFVGAVLCAASPAAACRVPWSPMNATPVAFTATVDMREEASGSVGTTVTSTLRVQRRIAGAAPDVLTAWASDEIVVGYCHPREDYDAELMEARAGDEIVVIGWERNGNLLISDLGRLNGAPGRALLREAEAAGRP